MDTGVLATEVNLVVDAVEQDKVLGGDWFLFGESFAGVFRLGAADHYKGELSLIGFDGRQTIEIELYELHGQKKGFLWQAKTPTSLQVSPPFLLSESKCDEWCSGDIQIDLGTQLRRVLKREQSMCWPVVTDRAFGFALLVDEKRGFFSSRKPGTVRLVLCGPLPSEGDLVFRWSGGRKIEIGKIVGTPTFQPVADASN